MDSADILVFAAKFCSDIENVQTDDWGRRDLRLLCDSKEVDWGIGFWTGEMIGVDSYRALRTPVDLPRNSDTWVQAIDTDPKGNVQPRLVTAPATSDSAMYWGFTCKSTDPNSNPWGNR